MKPIIFCGPSLFHDPVLACRDVAWRPPASAGDILRAACRKPRAIGLIDGRFESARSVWHKEILFALSEGIPVLGAASLGALRAAELAPFGMRGIGGIYRSYANGELIDDDEVAVLHADKTLAWRPFSEAMVDMRATIAQARADKVLSAKAAAELTAIAKRLFFKDRTWKRVLAAAPQHLALARFRKWLPSHRIEVKREDARLLVEAIVKPIAPVSPSFEFQPTVFWRRLMAEAGAVSK